MGEIWFWSTNIGLAWMCFATLLPLGILQLYESVNEGYFEARELEFLTNDTNALLEWLRLPGDLLFIVGGAMPRSTSPTSASAIPSNAPPSKSRTTSSSPRSSTPRARTRSPPKTRRRG